MVSSTPMPMVMDAMVMVIMSRGIWNHPMRPRIIPAASTVGQGEDRQLYVSEQDDEHDEDGNEHHAQRGDLRIVKTVQHIVVQDCHAREAKAVGGSPSLLLYSVPAFQ